MADTPRRRSPRPGRAPRARRGGGPSRGAREAQGLLRRVAGGRQDLRDADRRARGSRPTASTSSSASSRRTGAARPRRSPPVSRRSRARRIDYRGRTIAEFDLDAALARRPAVLLVDELAHTNAPGSRHPKRWQDVDELLAAGIDVYTTVNVQHLERLNDVVGGITGHRGARDRARPRVRRRRRGRARRPAARRPARAPQAGQGLPARAGGARGRATSSARATCSRCASSRCGAPPTASTTR